MNASGYNLGQKRNELSDVLEKFENLLNDLEIESAQLESEYAKKIFLERFAVLKAMSDKVIEYDTTVINYVVNHPDGHNVKYYKDQLEVAKLYIKANGLSWSTVLWGKISDY